MYFDVKPLQIIDNIVSDKPKLFIIISVIVVSALDNIVSDKPKLFIIISVIVVSALAIPVIIPHISYPQHIYHIVLHIGSLILSIFLFIISLFSYLRNGGSRLLFMSLGFLSLVIVE